MNEAKATGLDVVVCECLVTQSCLTLCDPMDCSPPGSSVHGILDSGFHRILDSMGFRQEYWSELPFPTPGNLPDPGISLTRVSCISCISLPTEPLGKPIRCCRVNTNFTVTQYHQEQPSLPQSRPPQNSQNVPWMEDSFVTSSYSIYTKPGETCKNPRSRRWQRPHLPPPDGEQCMLGEDKGTPLPWLPLSLTHCLGPRKGPVMAQPATSGCSWERTEWFRCCGALIRRGQAILNTEPINYQPPGLSYHIDHQKPVCTHSQTYAVSSNYCIKENVHPLLTA